MNQAEWERTRAEAEQLQEKVEKSQGEIYRLKAKLENAQSEKENLQVTCFALATPTRILPHLKRSYWILFKDFFLRIPIDS